MRFRNSDEALTYVVCLYFAGKTDSAIKCLCKIVDKLTGNDQVIAYELLDELISKIPDRKDLYPVRV